MSYPLNKGRRSYGRSITELLSDIGQSMKLMKKILKSVGTTSDTIEERRKFTALKTSVNEQIVAATRQMHRGSNSNRDYENEFILQNDVALFRTLIRSAVTQFKQYKPHNPHLYNNTSSESQPLISKNNNNRFHQMDDYQMESVLALDDETK
eukprot:75481_1